MTCGVLQVTAPGGPKGKAGSGDGIADSPGGKESEEGAGERRSSRLPPVATLLEFVAWVVWAELRDSGRSTAKLVSGPLLQELESLPEAALRVQVGCLALAKS